MTTRQPNRAAGDGAHEIPRCLIARRADARRGERRCAAAPRTTDAAAMPRRRVAAPLPSRVSAQLRMWGQR
jgi:hypothetical protein